MATEAPTPPTEAPAAEREDSGSKKRNGKKRYSKRLKDVQLLERGMSRASERIARALEGSLSTWRRERDRSAKKRKDGAFADALVNGADAVGRYAREAAWAPGDFIKGAKLSRTTRRMVSRLVLPMFK